MLLSPTFYLMQRSKREEIQKNTFISFFVLYNCFIVSKSFWHFCWGFFVDFVRLLLFSPNATIETSAYL